MHIKVVVSLLAGVFLLLSVAAVAHAEDQKKTATKEDRLSGTVHMIDKDASTIIIRKGADRRTVLLYRGNEDHDPEQARFPRRCDCRQACDLHRHAQREDPVRGHPRRCLD